MVIDMNYWKKVIKNILFLGFSILGIFISFKLAVFYIPFLIAFIISLILEPIIKKIMKKTKLKRRTSSIIVFIVSIIIIIGILVLGISSLISETSNLMSNFNEYADKAYNILQNSISSIDINKIHIPKTVVDTIQNSVSEFLNTTTTWLKDGLLKIILFVTSIPKIGIYLVITLLSLYFICVDKIYMLDQLEHHLPELWVKKIGIHFRKLVKTLGGYLKAEGILVLVSFFISLIGLSIFHILNMNVKYPLLIALGIAVVDALPIFGSGTVMLPWAIILGITGDITLAISILALWMIMVIVRQCIEPKIISGQIGIHPIFTLIAMYTGFKFVGIIGIFIGPIVLIILKNIYGTLLEKGIMKSIFER